MEVHLTRGCIGVAKVIKHDELHLSTHGLPPCVHRVGAPRLLNDTGNSTFQLLSSMFKHIGVLYTSSSTLLVSVTLIVISVLDINYLSTMCY